MHSFFFSCNIQFLGTFDTAIYFENFYAEINYFLIPLCRNFLLENQISREEERQRKRPVSGHAHLRDLSTALVEGHTGSLASLASGVAGRPCNLLCPGLSCSLCASTQLQGQQLGLRPAGSVWGSAFSPRPAGLPVLWKPTPGPSWEQDSLFSPGEKSQTKKVVPGHT